MFLRRFPGPLLSKIKDSTGIVGLDVVPNARAVLISLYNETLKVIQVIPPEAVYRQHVEKFTNFRLQTCQENENLVEIEKKVACGQVEELIEQAKDELELIPKMAEWKPWDVPGGQNVELETTEEILPSHLPTHRSF